MKGKMNLVMQRCVVSLLTFAMGLFVLGCKNQTKSFEEPDQNLGSSFVSLERAVNIAGSIGELATKNAGSDAPFSSVVSVDAANDSDGNPSFYIINYNKGFVLLAADNRSQPILAYSDKSQFNVQELRGNFGITDWMNCTKASIEELRVSDSMQSDAVAHLWEPDVIQQILMPNIREGATKFIIDPPIEIEPLPGIYCAPLILTQWSQEPGYNDLADYVGSCSKYANGRAPAGCATVAVAQIMRFHECPSSYDWSAMQNRVSTPETARLMRNVGVGMHITYGCESSGVKPQYIIPFLNSMGYMPISFASYNYATVRDELVLHKRPVLLSAKSGDDGHLWVCDGVDEHKIPWVGDGGPSETVKYLNMNWGWGVGRGNGYFTPDSWAVGKYNFNTYRQMIIDIRPYKIPDIS